MSTATKNRNSKGVRPVQEIRLGRVKVSIWANDTDSGVRHNVTLRRIYLDDEGKWQSTDSLGRDDLLQAAKVLDLAHSWIFAHGQATAGDASNQEEGGQDLPY